VVYRAFKVLLVELVLLDSVQLVLLASKALAVYREFEVLLDSKALAVYRAFRVLLE
jgi:hypothetical protein